MAYFLNLDIGSFRVPCVATSPMSPGSGGGPTPPAGPQLMLVDGKLEYNDTVPVGGRLVAYAPA